MTATIGKEDGVPVFKFKSWRQKGKILDSVFEQYKSVNATLNVMPFCSQFIPMEIIDAPVHKSIVYHPSILPRHRGANAIAWTLIEGDARAGLSIFWADDVCTHHFEFHLISDLSYGYDPIYPTDRPIILTITHCIHLILTSNRCHINRWISPDL